MTRRRFELIATAFDKKNKVICTATNLYNKSHPLMKAMAIRAGESEAKIYQHAEFRALLLAGDTEVYSLFVQRFAADGSFALAKPCRTCQEVIKFFGVREVRYTSPNGVVLMEL